MTTSSTLTLASVTMTEAVQRVREAGLYVQFERERLERDDVDRDRPIADSRRHFDVQLDLDLPVGRTLSRLTAADGAYDWLQVTDDPASYFIWPRAADGDRFARCVLSFRVGAVQVGGRPLSAAVPHVLAGAPREIPVFDRSGLLESVPAPTIETADRLAFEVLADLCAQSGSRIVWTLAGLADARVLSVGALV